MEERSFCIKSDRLVLPGGVVASGYLPVIEGVLGTLSVEPPAGLPIIDRTGRWVAPGYVDTHIHGYQGHDVMDRDAQGVLAASGGLARKGTTSWVPTTLTQPVGEILEACASVREARRLQEEGAVPGAHIEGVFLEGPFFAAAKAGAQNPANMLDPDVDVFCGWQDAAGGLVCKSALAPERQGTPEYCAALHEMGVVVALGHSDASYEQGQAAVAAGASVFVHTFNAMSALGHRSPGLVGCAMSTSDTFAELICDGRHVLPGAARALVAAKGWQHVVIVSDCLSCGGMPEGDYVLGDLPIRMQDGIARLVNEDGGVGNIAGSTSCVADGAMNLLAWGAATAEQAIRMGSEIPARSCGIDDVCGQLLPGRTADLNVLADDLTVLETYLAGSLVS
ncbi:N-acetylglucosamine-6-phosphate deacetylase [Olsenella sp. HMSC062G07]|uniref:N-acetylglucosamine-6-phosphate deacetylase n=1 Tax=Olsenella sp. HMSC062G07 TaxID=1739330 RepID=UPI0008A4A8E7|nr:N-acetylglucosamine-6-phosphate deacetylase [Olsenella sp. HMSC062G07]OFK23405.1 hypothetical protein HMPREF2826_04805 [Olsenella sp. HMSC062G07]